MEAETEERVRVRRFLGSDFGIRMEGKTARGLARKERIRKDLRSTDIVSFRPFEESERNGGSGNLLV